MSQAATSAVFLFLVLQAVAPQQSDSISVVPGHEDSDGLPTSGAKVCTGKRADTCFQMPAMAPSGEPPGFYQFGLAPEATRLAVSGHESWILFHAMCSGGGSGTLTRYAILRAENNGVASHLENVLPEVALTNQSDHAVWHIPAISPYPLFITADFVWDFRAGETHFAPHHFKVQAWQFNPASRKYAEKLSYRTSKKYNGHDDEGTITVISPERPEILRKLSHRR
jgi:hypothetical protein